jgi:tetratricopeptide (TPR) repeat protein
VLLDGLPLAIAQAGAYLQESGGGPGTYLRLYEQQWSELMQSDDLDGDSLHDYPSRSVWTTWAISYQAIRNRHEHTANLLLVWSFLDNKDLWHSLFAATCSRSTVAARMLLAWIGDVASSEVKFSRAMKLLRKYSLVEEVTETSYATHPVVHQWAHHSQGKRFATELSRLAVVVVGLAVPESSTRDYAALQRRLILHAQACSSQIVKSEAVWRGRAEGGSGGDVDKGKERETVLNAVHLLGDLYLNQDKLGEAEKMYERALRGKEEALGPNHTSTLNTVNNLGLLYADQGKLGEAEKMYERALRGKEEALGPTHTSTLNTVNNLGLLYKNQGKLGEAEKMYERALRGYEEALGPNHTSTLNTVNNLGLLYADQGKLGEAEKMYERALRGREEALGPTHTSTLNTVNNLGILYADQGKLGEAEKMYERALQGYEEALGPNHTSTLDTLNNLGVLYADQGKLGEAEKIYERALQGYEEALGPNHTSTLDTLNNLGVLYVDQGKLGKAEQMYERALRGYEALGNVRVQQYLPALNTLENMGDLYLRQSETAKAQAMYARALSEFSTVLGQSSKRCVDLAAKIENLSERRKEKEAYPELLTVSKRSSLQRDRKKISKLSIRRLIKKVF